MYFTKKKVPMGFDNVKGVAKIFTILKIWDFWTLR